MKLLILVLVAWFVESAIAVPRYAAVDVNATTKVRKRFKVGKNQWSGLTAPAAYALEVSILERLNEPRNTTPECSGRSFFPKLLERDDATLTFVQSYEGQVLNGKYEELHRRLCALPRSDVELFGSCATAALDAANVSHLDSFEMAQLAKNTATRDGKLTLIDFDIAQLDGLPSTKELDAARTRQTRHPKDHYAKLLLKIYDGVCRDHCAPRRRWAEICWRVRIGLA